MADYTKDIKSGIVHVISHDGCGEFTFCGREYSFREDYWDGAFVEEDHDGPATCPDCKIAIDTIRASIKGIRWRL